MPDVDAVDVMISALMDHPCVMSNKSQAYLLTARIMTRAVCYQVTIVLSIALFTEIVTTRNYCGASN